MKRFEGLKACFVSMLILSVVVLQGCGGGGGGSWREPAAAVSAFSLAGSSGVVNEPAHAVAVIVPFGTNVTAMVATYTTTAKSVKVGNVVQTSGVTANDFTSPVTYTMTKADGTVETYTVTVTVAPNFAKAITAFSIVEYPTAVVAISEGTTPKTIAVILPYGASVTALTANYTTTGNSVKVGTVTQISGTTTNDFTSQQTYTVTAADTTTANYNVSVTVALNPAKAITAFSFTGFPAAPVSIAEGTTPKTIAVTLPYGTPVTALTANYTTTGSSVKVGTVSQTSGTTPNSFASTVAYTVTAADASTATYNVTVTVAQNPAKIMTAFSFLGFAGNAGVISEGTTPKTIVVNLPFGTNVTSLNAVFTSTGASVKLNNVVETSGGALHDFSALQTYTVIASDLTTADYEVTVNVATVASVDIGTAVDFAILAKTGVSTVPGSMVTGNVGLSPAARGFLTGWSETAAPDASDVYSTSTQVASPYRLYASDYAVPTPNNLLIAVGNMETTYTDLAGRTATSAATTNVGAGTLSGLTLAPGVYEWGTAVTIPTSLTLNGSATDIWIFKIAGTLDMAGPKVILSGGALAKNVFWQASGNVTIGTGTHFEGIIYGKTKIELKTGASINGRLLAQTAVVLDANVVTQPAP
ncbi:MAG: ice-binding family protein [Geobacteraceae bacterium]|nr:ice-binding family protein [Geobacteraceae bacterium]